MALKRIRLQLARNRDFPEGSANHGYEFVAPLTADGHLDREAWPTHQAECTVHRFWPGEDDQYGHLLHYGTDRWSFHYDDMPEDEDEPIFKFDRHSFVEGEYVSITEHDGVQRTFRVARVRPA